MRIIKIGDRFVKVSDSLFREMGSTIQGVQHLINLSLTERPGSEKARKLVDKLVNSPELEYYNIECPEELLE